MREQRPTHIVLLALALPQGGAERQMIELATGLDERSISVTIVQLRDGEPLATEARSRGLRVETLPKANARRPVRTVVSLARFLRRLRPTAVYSFLIAPNVLAVLCRPWLRGVRVVWSVRSTDQDMSIEARRMRVAYQVEGLLSRLATVVIANSQRGLEDAVARRFSRRKLRVVHNGIDIDRYRPRPVDATLRACLGGSADTNLALNLARVHPMKGQRTFVDALGLLESGRWRGVIAGPLVSPDEGEALQSRIAQTGASAVLTGPLDATRANSVATVAVSSSYWGEGFSNALAEALACGVPVVATDVGDAMLLVGNDGIVVPPRDPDRLAAAIRAVGEREAALDPEERERRRWARHERIAREYSIDVMVSKTMDILCK